jgi:hypothetical protein
MGLGAASGAPRRYSRQFTLGSDEFTVPSHPRHILQLAVDMMTAPHHGCLDWRLQMNATTMSRIIAALSAITLLGACNDSFSPPPNVPTFEGLTVVPRSATIQAGQVVALKARLIDANGDPLSGVATSWTSSNEVVATVAATGEVLGRGAGNAIITATAQGKSQTAAIHVLGRPSKPDPKGEN